MATRFYLEATSTPAITPAFDSSWEDTSIGVRRDLYPYRIGFALGTVSFADANAANRDILFRQYISAPLDAQTIAAQTIKCQARVAERLATNNLFLTLVIRVCSRDGTSFTGTILASTRDDVEATTTLTNRAFSATSSSVTCNKGDRIVIEIGMGGDPDVGSDHDSDIRLGGSSATDLAEDDVTTTDNNPWLEFANTLVFETPPKRWGVKP